MHYLIELSISAQLLIYQFIRALEYSCDLRRSFVRQKYVSIVTKCIISQLDYVVSTLLTMLHHEPSSVHNSVNISFWDMLSRVGWLPRAPDTAPPSTRDPIRARLPG